MGKNIYTYDIIDKMNTNFVLFPRGNVLRPVTMLLCVITFVFTLSMFLAFSTFMYKYWIFVHIALFIVSCSILEYARVYDPRKQLPDVFYRKYTRRLCVFAHIMEQIVLFMWMLSMTYPKEIKYAMIENSIFCFLIVLRCVLFLKFFYINEIDSKKIALIFVMPDQVNLMVKISILIASISHFKGGFYHFIVVFYIVLYPIYSIWILSVFYGLFRDPVQQHEIQRPPAAVLADLEREPPPIEIV